METFVKFTDSQVRFTSTLHLHACLSDGDDDDDLVYMS